MNFEKELEFAKTLAYQAGDIMNKYFHSDEIGTTFKEDNSPITVADTMINDLVIDQVKKQFPNCGVIGEESSYETEREDLWIVDPIDGTKPYSLGIPVSTFCLAYVINGDVKTSVVMDPFQKRLYSAVKGKGAHVNDKPINVSNSDNLNGQNLHLGGRNFDKLVLSLRNRGGNFYDIYSFSYTGTLVASGNLVAAAMEYGSPWDAAAISLIVTEAGGRASDLNGEVRKYSQWGEGILVSNGLVHDKLVKMIDYENSRY